MDASSRYALDERADNYGWATLDQPVAAIPVDSDDGVGETTSVLSVAIENTAPDVLNRVNGWLALHSADGDLPRYFLHVEGVREGRAFFSVQSADAAPDARAALEQIRAGLAGTDPRTQTLLGVFLRPAPEPGQAGDGVNAASPVDVVQTAQASSSRIPLSVKSSFANASRRAVKFVSAPPPPLARAGVTSGVVVASPDTGIGRHPWLPGGTCVDAEKDLDWRPEGTTSLPDPGERNASPADGLTDYFAGHGTFVAGLIRQLAPSAQLLSLYSMAGDGTQPRDRVLHGLTWIRDRVATGRADNFVDVVCLACGYYEPSPRSDDHTKALADVLWELGDLGVQVVVAAGNDASEAPTFPAAFAHLAAEATLPRTPLVAVGALNPDGSRTDFTNFGDWVASWQPGAGLISALPTSFGTPWEGDLSEGHPFEPSNLVGGFAEWSGTSFAAAVLAGRVAAALETVKPAIPDVHHRTRAVRRSLGIRT